MDHGKSSFSTHTNDEKEDLDSKFEATPTENTFLVLERVGFQGQHTFLLIKCLFIHLLPITLRATHQALHN